LVSLAETQYNAAYTNVEGVKWLGRNLPYPYNGRDVMGNFQYTKAIDNGEGKEVAAAIRSLI